MRILLYLFTALVVLLIPTGCEDDCQRPGNCLMKPEAGPCLAYVRAYYYDYGSRTCKEFTWGGCGGTVPFYTLQECQGCICNQ